MSGLSTSQAGHHSWDRVRWRVREVWRHSQARADEAKGVLQYIVHFDYSVLGRYLAWRFKGAVGRW